MTERVRLSALLALISGLLSCSDDRQSPNEPEPQPVLSISDRSVDEGSTCLFTVSLDRAATIRVTYAFATQDITASAGSDYTAQSGADTIDAGQLSASILVPTSIDALSESDETFRVVISSVTGAAASDSVGIGTIVNTSDVSFSAQVQPLLRTSCASVACHGGSFPGGDFYTGTNVDYATLIAATGTNTALLPGSPDGKVIQPGNSGISTLYTKTTATPPFGSRMPSAASPLNTAQQNLIRDWIDQGALNN